jgi:AraC-like DNA-binding protein
VFDWLKATQHMIDVIEEHICDDANLNVIARKVGYSPFYCSAQFHRISGITIKKYISYRRLGLAAAELHNTKESLVDIAMKAGYSSQSAMTRSFKDMLNCTPWQYRKNPFPLNQSYQKLDIVSKIKSEGELIMSNLVVPSYRIEYIPEHKYLGLYKKVQTKNGPMWPGHDCDLLCEIIADFKVSHPIITAYTAGWTWESGERNYFFGSGVDVNYTGSIPEGFELRGPFPASYYIVFSHPHFLYPDENDDVMGRVENLAWNFIPEQIGWKWNEQNCQDYQRHYPEVLGYQVLRPVKRL